MSAGQLVEGVQIDADQRPGLRVARLKARDIIDELHVLEHARGRGVAQPGLAVLLDDKALVRDERRMPVRGMPDQIKDGAIGDLRRDILDPGGGDESELGRPDLVEVYLYGRGDRARDLFLGK